MGLGPEGSDAVGGGVLYGEESFVIRPRAQSVSSISKERGVSGDADPFVGMTRVVLPMEVSAVMKRGSMTDEALCDEASRYVETLSLSVGGRELSSSTLSSRFDRARMKEGAFAGLASVIDGEEQLPLSIILADGSNGELVTEGEKSLGGEGKEGGLRLRICYRIWMVKDVDGTIAAWRGSTSFWVFRRKVLKAKF